MSYEFEVKNLKYRHAEFISAFQAFFLAFSFCILLLSCNSKKPSSNLIPITKLEKFASNTSQIVFDKEVTKLGYKFNQKIEDTTTGLSTFLYLEKDTKDDPKKMHSAVFFAQREKPVVGLQFISKDELVQYQVEILKYGYKETLGTEIKKQLGYSECLNTTVKYFENSTFNLITMETLEYGMLQVWRK